MLDIYKASAGSGKTYTLTLEYIKMLLGKRDEDGRYQFYKTYRRLIDVFSPLPSLTRQPTR